VSTEPISPGNTPPAAAPELVRRSTKHVVPKPNEGVWPGLATPPNSPARARIAESLFRRAVRSLPVRIVFPGGERIGAGGPGSPVMRIVRPAAFFNRVGAGSKIGSASPTWRATGPPPSLPTC
jgi:cyclopropane-fatty-acyl-phospholipid synthase